MSIFIGLRPEGYDFSFKKRSPHFILVEESRKVLQTSLRKKLGKILTKKTVPGGKITSNYGPGSHCFIPSQYITMFHVITTYHSDLSRGLICI